MNPHINYHTVIPKIILCSLILCYPHCFTALSWLTNCYDWSEENPRKYGNKEFVTFLWIYGISKGFHIEKQVLQSELYKARLDRVPQYSCNIYGSEKRIENLINVSNPKPEFITQLSTYWITDMSPCILTTPYRSTRGTETYRQHTGSATRPARHKTSPITSVELW